MRLFKRDRRQLRSAAAVVMQGLEARQMLAGDFEFVNTFGADEEIESAVSIQADNAGSVYVAGNFINKVDVDPGPGTVILQSNGKHDDVFLIKYSEDGDLIWARRFGGPDDDHAIMLRLGPDGDVYLTGNFQQTVNWDGTTLRSHGHHDAFIAHLDADGNTQWVGSYGGGLDDAITSIAVGPDDDVYVGGTIRLKGDINPTSGTTMIKCLGADDTFVQRLDAGSGGVVWSKVFGQNDTREQPLAMAVDSDSNLYLSGDFNNTVRFDRSSNKFTRTSSKDNDVYLARINPNGSWGYVKSFGGENQDHVSEMVVGSSGDLFLTGTFKKTANFNTSGKAIKMEAIGDTDAYIARYHPSGQAVWARQIGGEDTDVSSYSISVDDAENIFTTGTFIDKVDFNPGKATKNIEPDKSDDAPKLVGQHDSSDGYVESLDGSGNFRYVRVIDGRDGSTAPLSISADSSGNVYVAGTFANKVDFDPGPGVATRKTLSDHDDQDPFTLKLSA